MSTRLDDRPQPPEAIVFVFAKPPRPGESKSRLAASIGDEAAARLAGAFLRDVWEVARALPWAKAVLAGTDSDARAYGLGDVPFVTQGEGDLGERMERVLRLGLERAPVAILVGSDCPGLDRAAFDAVRQSLVSRTPGSDGFLVPVDDGGFCLVAVTRCPAGIFAGVPWSAPNTAEATQSRMRALGMTVTIGNRWWDVDDVEGLESLAARIEAGVAVAPQTAAALRATREG